MQLQTPTNDFFPIAVLMDELKHEDVSIRLAAIRKISVIALALGQERAREELIPFLEESLDDEDEVLYAIAEEIGSMVDLIGGKQYSHYLLAALETLAAAEEVLVREKAVESIGRISIEFSPEQAENYLLACLQRLLSGEWFTGKTSASQIIRFAYPLVSFKEKENLKKSLVTLVEDPSPMVRRAAASSVIEFTKLLTVEEIEKDIIPIISIISADDQDSVRLKAVAIAQIVAEILDSKTVKSVYSQLKVLISDESWKVRYVAAKEYGKITMVALKIQQDPVELFLNLLRDSEADVRCAAASQAPAVSAQIPVSEIVSRIIPTLYEMAKDNSQQVKSCLAENLCALSPLIGKQHTVDHLMGIFIQLLRDESSDVRLGLISKIVLVNKVVGIDLLHHSLLPCMIELSEDSQWRVRLALIQQVPMLAEQFGQDFFSQQFGARCLVWLSDPVFCVRDAACLNLKNLSLLFGADWVKNFALVHIEPMTNSDNYLQRLTSVMALSSLASGLDDSKLILVALKRLSLDLVPNIRLSVAKALNLILPNLIKNNLGQEANEILQVLSKDLDSDVRYFAQQ